jgi:hypothetical protein
MEAARLLQNSNEPIRINLFGVQTLDHARECAMTGAEMVTIHIGLVRSLQDEIDQNSLIR